MRLHICIGGICYCMMPRRRRELVGYDVRLLAVSVLRDLKQVMSGLRVQGLKAPIVQYEQFDAGEAFEPAGGAAVAALKGEFVESRRVEARRLDILATPCGAVRP